MTFQTVMEIALAVLGSVTTGGVIVAALSSWLGKVWANRILEKDKNYYAKEMFDLTSRAAKELEALKKRLETNATSFKLEFEKEFQIYTNLWSAVVNLRNQMFLVLTLSDSSNTDHGKVTQTSKSDAVKTSTDAIKEVLQIYDINKPFYPKNIYERASDVAKLCNKLLPLSVNYDPKNISSGYIDEIVKESRLLFQKADELCEAIRARVDTASSIIL
jgi:hypothetical protein